MTKTFQTTFHNKDGRGNCMAAVVASFLDLPIDQVPKFEELMVFDNPNPEDNKKWVDCCSEFLADRGFVWGSLDGHTEGFYIVVGRSPRGDFNHCCIYQNGLLWHDPHPSGAGLLTETHFEFIDEF